MKIDGVEGSNSKKIQRQSIKDTMRGDAPLSTSEKRIRSCEKLSCVAIKRYCQQKRKEKRLLQDEFKKEKPPKFYGEVTQC